ERVRGTALAAGLGMPILARAWQMLLKGLGEARAAPAPLAAAEMVIIRLAYVADLPTPGELVKQVKEGGAVPTARASSPPSAPARPPAGGRPGGAALAVA